MAWGEPSVAALVCRRVLVVDDDRDTRDMTTALLRTWGYNVRAVGDGSAALAHISCEHPEIILLDITLPGMDGYELARKLRACERADERRALLVALTGHAQACDRQRALAAGFDAHLVKPVDFSQLREVMCR